MVRVTFQRGEFLCKSSFEARAIPRQAGFSFDPARKCWFAFDPAVAARLRPYLDERAKNEIDRILLSWEPYSGSPRQPENGKTAAPFQIGAAKFLLSRNRAYLAGDPGIGKTIAAALTMNAMPTGAFIYLCPPFLVGNVENELRSWVINAGRRFSNDEVIIVKDSVLGRDDVRDLILAAYARAKMESRPFRIFIDEAHRFKNEGAGRTAALFGSNEKVNGKTVHVPGILDTVREQTYLSGTPMPNRAMELYPVLSHAAPETISFMSKFDYGRKFCGGHHNGFGWEFQGSTNIDELKARTSVEWTSYEKSGETETTRGKFILRIRKSVLNLPPLVEEIVILESAMPAKVGALDRQILSRFGGEDEMKEYISEGKGLDSEKDLHVSTYRKELGIAKVDSAIPYIKSILEDTDENLLVAFWHREVGKHLQEGLKKFDPILIDGSVSPEKRVPLANEYQTNKNRRVVLVNIIAGGIGLNMQKADRVVSVESSWVPGENQQVADRAHRFGREGSVLVQHLVYKNSIDRVVMEVNLNKRRSMI